MTARDRVLIELLTDQPEHLVHLLPAVLGMLGEADDVAIASARRREPTALEQETLTILCSELARRDLSPLPTVTLLGGSEADGYAPTITLTAHAHPHQVVAEIVRLALHRSALGPETQYSPVETLRAARDAAIGQRDLVSARVERPIVAVLVQVQSTWGAVESVVQALSTDPWVRVELVAVDSEQDKRSLSTADFVRSQGFEPRDVAWLDGMTRDPESGLSLAVFYDPWDGLRPTAASALTLANRGVRIAYVPYGNNVGDGLKIRKMAYDLPTHRLAWRAFARSERQRDMYGRYCATGNRHVQALGLPKFDRVVALHRSTPPRRGPMTVLWNPHFTLGSGGWSTFDRILGPLVEWAADNPDARLIMRPHFRLFHDLPHLGEDGTTLLDILQKAPRAFPNIMLDDSADYLDSFAQADALISDTSSLISEFALTEKPILYLHRQDGPGLNEDAQYFFEGAVASDWAGVEGFLARLRRELDDVRAGQDPDFQRRALLVDRHFPMEDGRSGARIAVHLAAAMAVERKAAALAGSGQQAIGQK